MTVVCVCQTLQVMRCYIDCVGMTPNANNIPFWDLNGCKISDRWMVNYDETSQTSLVPKKCHYFRLEMYRILYIPQVSMHKDPEIDMISARANPFPISHVQVTIGSTLDHQRLAS